MKTSWREAAARLLREASVWSAAAVFLAGLLLCEVNLLAARSHERWDFSLGQRFSASPATRKLLAELTVPVEVIVLLPRAHPLHADVRQMLQAFSSDARNLEVRYVDPDRDAAEFLALIKEQEAAGHNAAEPGELSEAAMLVRQAERSWFVAATELHALDAEGQKRPRIEAALASAILRVQTSERQTVCFVTGHGEKSLDDGADDGLAEFGRSLEIKNLEAERTPLDVPRPEVALRRCNVVAIIGPTSKVPPAHEDVLLDAARQGKSFLLFLDPIVDARGAFVESGLDRLTAWFGVELPGGFVLERRAAQRLPQGIGEAFLAEVLPHPVTSGLSSEGLRLDRRAVLVAAQPVELASGSTAATLLTASTDAVVLDRLGTESEPSHAASDRRPGVAAAARIPSDAGPETRAVIVGSSNFVDSRSFRDPALLGNRSFAEQALAWVASKQFTSAIPDQEALPAGLALTEESLTDILYYVMIYMPGAAGSIGLWIILRRRQRERQAREATERGEP